MKFLKTFLLVFLAIETSNDVHAASLTCQEYLGQKRKLNI
jgi:hypothetical protein